jgi:hypothetical protein
MKGLKCTTSNCEHNVKCHCTAGIINVGENAVCCSKIKRVGGALSQTFADMEAAVDMDTLANEEVLVQCDAECKFNSNSKCTREHLLVEDSIIKTKCFSRQKPDK